jgi:hypothetical protein
MSVSGLSLVGSIYQALQSSRTQGQNVQSEFQQLGKDLQAGNVTQAAADYTTLSQSLPASLQASSNSPLAQAFSALGQALQSGNLSAAQTAYTTIQQDVQQSAGQTSHHHHHHWGGSASANSTASNSLTQDFSALGQALQSGTLSAAQAAYTTLQQDLQQFGWNAVGTQSGTGQVSLTG